MKGMLCAARYDLHRQIKVSLSEAVWDFYVEYHRWIDWCIVHIAHGRIDKCCVLIGSDAISC